MKKNDFIFISGFVMLFIPFIVSSDVLEFYSMLNFNYPIWMSFLKFSILATLGEVIGLRIRKGIYFQKGFGLLPRALVWGFLGISIKMAFVIFGIGGPQLFSLLGIQFPDVISADILNRDFFQNPSIIHVLAAFSVSLTMNLFFAPVFMTVHKITDEHILMTNGRIDQFFTLPDIGKILRSLNWDVHWNFVLKKTIPLFWIPAQTINFLLPGEIRILVAAMLGIVLGVILSFASIKGRTGGK